MPKIITIKDRAHWLQMKSEDISSTETAALFGLSPYSSEFELYHEKLSGEIKEIDDNERMYCGRMMEDTIAKMVAETLGIKVRRLKTYARHDTCPRMGSSFDYEIVAHEDGAGILEIKNVDSLVFRNEWDTNEAPPHIETQVQHQKEIMNRDWCKIAALVGGNTLHIIHRERNKEVGKAICNRINKFWYAVDNQIEPTPNFERDAQFIIGMYNKAYGDPLDISEDKTLQAMVTTYQELRDRYNAIGKAADALKAEIFMQVKEAPKLFTDDGLTVTLTQTKDTPPTLITEDMVGESYGGREGYRQFRVNDKRK